MEKEIKGATPARFWNIVTDDSGDSATISLYGEVVYRRPVDWLTGEKDDAQYICPEDFAADLEKIKTKSNITININSIGGDVYTAVAIHNALKSLTGRKTVIIDGIAASAASLIAMAGDSIKMYAGSIMMIHNVSGLLCDWYTIQDLKKIIRSFDVCERSACAIYGAKTGLEDATIRSMMDKETWMTGAEAVQKGFADEVIDGETSIEFSAANRVMVVNGVRHKTDGLHVPAIPSIKPLAMAATAPANVQTKPETKEGVEKMDDIKTVDDLRAKFPELCAKIEAEAVAADRARIQEIEEIQDTIGDAELIAAAKFVKPTNAAALALEAMKRAKAQGKQFMDARAEEGQQAAQVKAAAAVQAESVEDIASQTKAAEEQAIKNTAELFKKTFCK